MKALVYHGPGLKALGDSPRPNLKLQTDAIVEITTMAIMAVGIWLPMGPLADDFKLQA